MVAPPINRIAASPDPEQWVDDHGDALFGFALKRVRQREVAEDLVQECLLAAYEASGRARQIENERAWLIGILKHKIFDYFRRSARDHSPSQQTEEIPDPAGDGFDERGAWATAPQPWRTPDNAMETDQFMAVLSSCIDDLPLKLRSTFVLRELEGIKPDLLARALATSRNHIWVMLSRARQRLRACLQQHWFGV